MTPPGTLTIHLSARSVVTTLGILLLFYAASLMPGILIMALVALILSAAMLPGVSYLQGRRGWPRGGAIAAMFGLIFGVLTLLGLIVVPTVIEQSQTLAANLPLYLAKVRQTYSWVLGLDQRFHMLPDLDEAAQTFSRFAGGWLSSTLGWAGKVLGGVATVFLIFITTFFILLDGPDLKRGLLSLIPPNHRGLMAAQFDPIALKLGAYVQGVLTSIGFLTLYLAICLSLAGVPLAFALALIAGACELVPLVGSLLGAIPAVIIALTVGPGTAGVVVAIFLVGNLIQGNVVAPFVFARSVEVSPVMILFALLIGAQLMGFAGAVIAIPLMAMVQVLVQNLYVEPMERAYASELARQAAALPVPPAADLPDGLNGV